MISQSLIGCRNSAKILGQMVNTSKMTISWEQHGRRSFCFATSNFFKLFAKLLNNMANPKPGEGKNVSKASKDADANIDMNALMRFFFFFSFRYLVLFL